MGLCERDHLNPGQGFLLLMLLVVLLMALGLVAFALARQDAKAWPSSARSGSTATVPSASVAAIAA
jgi:hypothetical protein